MVTHILEKEVTISHEHRTGKPFNDPLSRPTEPLSLLVSLVGLGEHGLRYDLASVDVVAVHVNQLIAVGKPTLEGGRVCECRLAGYSLFHTRAHIIYM